MSTEPPVSSRRTGILKRPCPQCGETSLRRVGSHQNGEAATASRKVAARATHMRCMAPGCHFDGWITRRIKRRRAAWWTRRHTRQLLARLRPWARALTALCLLGLGAGVGAAVGSVWQQVTAPTLAQLRATLPPGEYHDGDPLPGAHPLSQPEAKASTPLDLRGACVWGRPGRDPYRGSVAEALRTAQLPTAVQAQLVAKIAAKQSEGRLVIANDGIRDEAGSRHFAAAGFAMTYGRTLCLETRVNFATGHTEGADLYEVQGERGRRYAVMVPDVCGNVSIIADASPTSEDLLRRGVGQGMPSQLRLTTLEGGGEGDLVRTVPAPSTLLCVLGATLAWLGSWWWPGKVARPKAVASRS